MLTTSYSRPIEVNVSDIVDVSRSIAMSGIWKDETASRMSVKDANETGMERGDWIARRVKTS